MQIQSKCCNESKWKLPSMQKVEWTRAVGVHLDEIYKSIASLWSKSLKSVHTHMKSCQTSKKDVVLIDDEALCCVVTIILCRCREQSYEDHCNGRSAHSSGIGRNDHWSSMSKAESKELSHVVIVEKSVKWSGSRCWLESHTGQCCDGNAMSWAAISPIQETCGRRRTSVIVVHPQTGT